MDTATTMRINKALAAAGVCSRRRADELVAAGRVTVNGTVVVEQGYKIDPTSALLAVDGVPVALTPADAAPLTLMHHKKAGVVTTASDPEGRPTVFDDLPEQWRSRRLFSVGRLDFYSEGLLLLTTDGGLKRQLELPSTGVERTYRARVFGEVTQTMLDDLIEGIEIEGVRYGSIDANLERRTGRNGWVEMKLREGKNREVRRVLEHLGLQVSRLIRTSYGPFRLGDLPVGAVDEVLQHDLVNFRKTLK